ncbi:hypothetical protein [Neptuniibacter sp. QD37_11]|uniref:hypothetical protein n=1 Tax=Neptuniibacter sp. QD37_11 TaxID=3398209 RepID=UPI0039F4615A
MIRLFKSLTLMARIFIALHLISVSLIIGGVVAYNTASPFHMIDDYLMLSGMFGFLGAWFLLLCAMLWADLKGDGLHIDTLFTREPHN